MTKSSLSGSLEPAIEAFLVVLRGGWKAIAAVSASRGDRGSSQFLADWAQANWEAIVEATVSSTGLVFLEPYGDGADCNPVGSRVWMPDALPTHAVCCKPIVGLGACDWLSDEEVVFPDCGIAVDRFAALSSEGWWVEQAPFDHVLGSSDGCERLFRLSDVRLVLSAVADRSGSAENQNAPA